MLPEIDKRVTLRDLRIYHEKMDKPCHGKCWDGWYHVAYSKADSGEWEIYKLPCKCVFPGGLYYDELAQDHRYKRRADYTGTWSGKVPMHPQNLPKISQLFKAKEVVFEDDEIPF